MSVIENTKVEVVFEQYPKHIQSKLLILRQLIMDTAKEIEDLDHMDETLKWGEPSYITKKGSTIRIGWKQSSPDQYAMYFNCNTKLVDTFKEVYKDLFHYEGNRAIVFAVNDEIPINELKQCIVLALTYHTRKHLPLLGI
ncbi:DUF1801 domain-containing protein [Lysinibacillus pakistanensis]|uniref:DUF1801 domain-containing protein n=1 Tax=Lysinibacillus pakistanensis TaxID=759811 RepID=A0AAX3X1R8_9BACI|nr:DUF1801 domain-containing protein [Lysinibacillus pakistanensis]MDM5232811.1 DUF1801 domain-containing protein [Lysinibacillus pakistanensis]WHY48309.1 DUF1801 domain-containing protein [Lysinibacillus pakistanensis]WHY53322.1 DUF1801 domain-containing protein [Lysinibacillus pakistanensis]